MEEDAMKIVFVTRPAAVRPMGVLDALRLTAKNGKALQRRRPLGGAYVRDLPRESLVLHQTRRGKVVYAWCENGTRAKKGTR